jgi:hypothetical protein
MSIWRRCLIAVVVLGAAFAAEAFFGGCARITRQVQVCGLIVDASGTPLGGAEVYASPAALTIDDEALARIKDDVDPSPPEIRERLSTITDAGGRFTLVLRVGQCRPLGPISSTLRALLGEPRPSPQRYAIVAQAAGGGRRTIVKTADGAWANAGRGTPPRWIYEMPPISLAAR